MVVLDLKSWGDNKRSSTGSSADLEQLDANLKDLSVTSSADRAALSSLLNALQKRVLVGDSYSDLALRIEAIKADLSSTAKVETSLQSGIEFDSILETYQLRLHDANLETAIDFKKILSLVNESFGCVQAGDQKSEERLKYLENSLKQAARIDSLVSLRRHLSGMLDFIRREGRTDVAEKESRLQSMSEQMRQAQLVSLRLRVQMPGRLDALNHMQALVASSSGKAEAQVSLFVVDTLGALRARHGEEIASNILEELGRKQVQPIAPEGRLFCWSASSLILISRPPQAGNSPGLLCAVPATFEYRAFTGTRVATFKVSVRSISTTLGSSLEEVTSTLDRFSNEGTS